MNAVARDLGYPAVARETFHAGWGQGIEADVRRFYPRHTVPEIERAYAERFAGQLEHLAVTEGVAEVFAALRRRGLSSAVVTNTPASMAIALVARAGAEPDTVVGGTDVPRAKPAPDMVLEACARLGVAPGASFVVGDSRFDREAAHAAGAGFAGLGLEGDVRLARLTDLVLLLGPS